MYIYLYMCIYIWDSLMTQMVKNLPAMQETRVLSLIWDKIWDLWEDLY